MLLNFTLFNARVCYLIWRNNSKPRHGPEYEDMKVSRARFQLALRECRRNEELMKAYTQL